MTLMIECLSQLVGTEGIASVGLELIHKRRQVAPSVVVSKSDSLKKSGPFVQD